jgi:alkaline phosphatase D
MKKNKLKVLSFVVLLTGVFALQAQKQTVVTKIGRKNTAGIENYFNTALAPFYHGVASGDPLKDAVIIWTRVTTNQPDVNVTWKVATNTSMTNVVQQGIIVTDERKDYTVKVDVRSLQPNTTYYFQFEALGKKSEIGKTRTSPTGNVSNVRFGVVSCSNYQNGYFNAYEELADRTDIDEIVTLSDYRVRYSYYRLDPMLRKLHQQHPFILIWDDHEFSNDANKFGAENHDPSTEGSWEVRKNNAYKAYFEWMPVRANSIQEYRLYRDFSYGDLADLLMLDTRIEGRDETVSTSQKLTKSAKKDLQSKVKSLVESKSLQSIEDFEKVIEEIAPYFIQEGKLTGEELRYVIQKFAQVAYNYKNVGSRNLSSKEDQSKLKDLLVKATTVDAKLVGKATYESILGQAQFNWFLSKLSTSSATWKIIGNQVMMMNYSGVPTSDAWDGYEEERERLYQHISNNNINNVVVLTGDIHSTFAGDLKYGRECIGSEFVVPSVTSQNLDAFGGIATELAEFYTKLLNRHMKEVDLDAHGYFVLDVKEERVQADWFYIRDVTVPNSGEFYHKGYYVNKNGCGIIATNTPANATSRYGEQAETIHNSTELIDEGTIIMGVYPNPMQTSGNIHYLLQNPTELSILIFNSNGQKVKDVLINKKQDKGIYNVRFDVESLAAGNYFLKVKAGNKTITKQFIVR